jgi:2'-5' RNA ligase
MRVFFGIELPEDVKAAAGGIASGLRHRVERVAPRAAIRWVDPENLHITLWFIGEAGEERLATVTEATAARYAVAAFPLALSGLGAFPPTGSPRVIWLGIAAGVPQLQALYQDLSRRLAPLGFQSERRPYAPHLTIARIKDIQRRDAVSLRQSLASSDGVLSAEIAQVTLFRSQLSPKGARYEPLLRVPLS